MKMTDLFLAELEQESAATRRVLERAPDGRYDWKPHEKSMTLGHLAELVARMPSWPVFMIKKDELDLATVDGLSASQRRASDGDLRPVGGRRKFRLGAYMEISL